MKEKLSDLKWQGAYEELKKICHELGDERIPERIPRWRGCKTLLQGRINRQKEIFMSPKKETQKSTGFQCRGKSRGEGPRPGAEGGSTKGKRGKRRADGDRQDAGTGSRHSQAAACDHQSQRANPLAENLVRVSRVRQ